MYLTIREGGKRPFVLDAKEAVSLLYWGHLPEGGSVEGPRKVRWTVRQWAAGIHQPLPKIAGWKFGRTRTNPPEWKIFQDHVCDTLDRKHGAYNVEREPSYPSPNPSHTIRPDIFVRERGGRTRVVDSKFVRSLRKEDVLQVFSYRLLLDALGAVAIPLHCEVKPDVDILLRALVIARWKHPLPDELLHLYGD